jgi:hypothetical protein
VYALGFQFLRVDGGPARADDPVQMTMRNRSSLRRARWLATAAAALACLLAPALAHGARGGDAGDDLSPALAELAEPALQSAPPAAVAAELGVAPQGPGSLLRRGDRVLADVRFEAGAAAGLDPLRSAGAAIVAFDRSLQTVTVAAPPEAMPSLAALPQVASVSEVLAPIVAAADCPGAATSEGDTQLRAATARTSFNVDGSGVTVGILSDSFDLAPAAAARAATDVTSGDLPGSGNPCGRSGAAAVVDDSMEPEKAEDEGRAMAQVVHDLAPGAALRFATAFRGEIAFAGNIRRLAGEGAAVLADDVAYLKEPFFQDGPIAVAVNEVAARGVSYFSAAGNNNVSSAEGDLGSWEAPAFRDAAAVAPPDSCPPGTPAYAKDCMDFDPASDASDTGFGIVVAPGATVTVDLQWAQPWNGVTTDLDGYLLSEGVVLTPGEGDEVLNVDETQRPVEILSWTNEGPTPRVVELAINRCDTACDGDTGGDGGSPRLKFIVVGQDGEVTPLEYLKSTGGDTVGPTVFGHNGAEGAVTVAAVRYNKLTAPEPFSSRGPVKHFFGPVLGAAPAPPLAATRLLAKPDLAAVDGGANTFFGSATSSGWRFFGTSAAAPHAAAIAALAREANPDAGAAAVRSALTGSARPVGSSGQNAVGAGLIDAFGTVAAVALPPRIVLTQVPKPLDRNRRPTLQFSASRPVSFSCAVDGAPAQPCSSPFTVPISLADGPHGVAVIGTDAANRVGVSPVASFTVDTRAPRTRIAKHPRKLIRIHRRNVRLGFRFRASETGVVFICKVDRGLLRFCGPRITRRFGEGKHIVKVRARDGAGNVDRTPAVYRFQVKRRG